MHLPSLFRRKNVDPYRSLYRLQNDFDQFFQDWSTDTDLGLMKSDLSLFPSCEISEDKNAFLMKLDMPGVKKQDVKIDLDGTQLTISAERREEKKSDGDGRRSRFSEISYGSYQRSFTLPSHVDQNRVDAKFENGVLTLTLPKAEQANTKQITVS